MRPIDSDALMDKTVHMAKVCYGEGQCYCTRTQFQKMIDDAPTIDAISMREWNLLRNSIKELQENNTEKKDIQFVTNFLLRLMDISERREFNNEM